MKERTNWTNERTLDDGRWQCYGETRSEVFSGPNTGFVRDSRPPFYQLGVFCFCVLMIKQFVCHHYSDEPKLSLCLLAETLLTVLEDVRT